MFDAALRMSGEKVANATKCIIGYEIKQHHHTFTLMEYDTGKISTLVLSNLLFDNGLSIADISDTSLTQRDNSCWNLEFAIHSRDDWKTILKQRSATFIDSRLWVPETKLINCTKWKHPYTEMSNGVFNARPGYCSNTAEFLKRLIVIGSDLYTEKKYKIERISKHGFMQVETESGMVTQHLNNFDEVNPADVSGVWFNDSLNLWVFEDNDYVNTIEESYVYLLLDTHARQQRFCAKDQTGPFYTYDYTKAKAFFSETEAINYAKYMNRVKHSTFTVDQWI